MRQILGMKDLIEDTIEATVIAIAKAHQDIARLPYAVLEQSCALAGGTAPDDAHGSHNRERN